MQSQAISPGPEFVPVVNRASRGSSGSHLLGEQTSGSSLQRPDSSLQLNRKEAAFTQTLGQGGVGGQAGPGSAAHRGSRGSLYDRTSRGHREGAFAPNLQMGKVWPRRKGLVDRLPGSILVSGEQLWAFPGALMKGLVWVLSVRWDMCSANWELESQGRPSWAGKATAGGP